MTSQAKYISIDPGQKFIGVAISPHGRLAQGLTTISTTDPNRQIKKLTAIIKKHNPEKIIIGKTQRGKTKNLSHQIANQISKSTNTPVTYVDEYKSSLQAKQAQISSGKNPSQARQDIHQTAAACILQNFLDDLVQ